MRSPSLVPPERDHLVMGRRCSQRSAALAATFTAVTGLCAGRRLTVRREAAFFIQATNSRVREGSRLACG
jgi:hypothetical protein